MYTEGQIMAWYHEKIPRIQHGKRVYEKRYMTDDEVLRLFRGTVYIQEKVDGKLSIKPFEDIRWLLKEDISGKHTVHDHVLKYKANKSRIELDIVSMMVPDVLHFEPFSIPMQDILTIAVLRLENPTLKNIYAILEALSKLPSRLGAPVMEGLVIKNYPFQLMGKWVNEEFEDKLKYDSEK